MSFKVTLPNLKNNKQASSTFEKEMQDEKFKKAFQEDCAVNHPDHYNLADKKCAACNAPIECIQITRTMGFNLGNAIKYIWRCEHKGNKIQDLKKALWYLQDEISRLEKQEERFP